MGDRVGWGSRPGGEERVIRLTGQSPGESTTTSDPEETSESAGGSGEECTRRVWQGGSAAAVRCRDEEASRAVVECVVCKIINRIMSERRW